jgi:hypothetical protein
MLTQGELSAQRVAKDPLSIRAPETLKMSPAMAADVSARLCSMKDLVAAMDDREILRKRARYSFVFANPPSSAANCQ